MMITVHDSAETLRDSWQGRTLGAARGKLAAVLLSVLAHNYDDAMPALLRAVFPGYTGVAAPFLCSAGRISARGRVYAKMVNRAETEAVDTVLYRDETELQNAFRTLADTLKLSDTDRIDMFQAVARWIVCDYRINPNTGEKETAA